jgi:CRISPR-associated protein Csx17
MRKTLARYALPIGKPSSELPTNAHHQNTLDTKFMNSIPLEGCTPEPLINYLKALGVLKIVIEQKLDSEARGCWKDGIFQLFTTLTAESLVAALSDRYQPSPILSPWNEAAGFKKKKGTDVEAVRKAGASSALHYTRFKNTVETAQAIVAEAKSDDDKDDLILSLRNKLPDDVIQWLDACGSYGSEKCQFAPFLGTGGNVGKMEISINYLKNISILFDEKKHEKSREPWLRSALFSSNEERYIFSSVSQFAPGQAGGANATQGTEGKSMINPWDFILMIEGSLFLTSSTTRKLSSQRTAKSAFPFTVDVSAVGSSVLALSDLDNQKGRGELWMPLWSRSSSLGELKSLFAEGRAELRGRQATNGLDFARAVAGLGVDRGIKHFMRFSIVEFVKAGVMATPLGQFKVAAKNDANLLKEIDTWLSTMKRACNDKTPSRFRALLRETERAIFDYCQHGDNGSDKSRFQRILISLGNAERVIAKAPKFRSDAKGLRPIGSLSTGWVAAADDGSPEFEIALALASLDHADTGSLRKNLEDVEIRGSSVSWTDRNHSAVWSAIDLAPNLAAILSRRVMDADKNGNAANALKSSHRASLSAVAKFIAGELDEARITDLLWSLSLCKLAAYKCEKRTEETPILPAAYRLLKLLFHSSSTDQKDSAEPRPNLGILSLLRADRAPEASQRAVRILRGNGLTAKPFAMRGFPTRDSEWRDLTHSECTPAMISAALLIPISHSALAILKAKMLREKSPS